MKSILLTTTLLLTTFATKCCGTHCKVLKAESITVEEGLNILKSIGEYKTESSLTEERLCANFTAKLKDKADEPTINKAAGGFDYFNPASEFYFHANASEENGSNDSNSEMWLFNKGSKTYNVSKTNGVVDTYIVKDFETKQEAFESIGTGLAFILIFASSIGYGMPQVAYENYTGIYEALYGKTIEGEDIPDESKKEVIDCQFLSTGEPGNLEYTYIIKNQKDRTTEYHGKYEHYYGTEYSYVKDSGEFGEWTFDFNSEVERVPLPAEPKNSSSSN